MSEAVSESSSRNAPIIEVENASVYRGDVLVFNDFSISLAADRNTAIVGPNGAGKSTLLKLLCREIYPVFDERTSVRIFGREKWNVWELRADLGIVSHELQHNYAPIVPGLQVVLSGFYASVNTWGHQNYDRDQLEKAKAVMRQLDIDALAERRFDALSTGQQRRFLLARALINDPKTLILDEPTSGLDLKATFQYIDTMRSLMTSGRTVILVTHHIHEIPPEVDWVVLLKAGRVVAEGRKAQILTPARLSDVFDTAVRVVTSNGFYQVLPG